MASGRISVAKNEASHAHDPRVTRDTVGPITAPVDWPLENETSPADPMPFVRWEDPPPAEKSGGKMLDWSMTVGFLRAHPGKWALVAETANAAYSTRLRKMGCETARRGFATYARWPEFDDA